MKKETMVTRRGFVAGALGAAALLANPRVMFAAEKIASSSASASDNLALGNVDEMTTDEYIEAVDSSGTGWTSYAMVAGALQTTHYESLTEAEEALWSAIDGSRGAVSRVWKQVVIWFGKHKRGILKVLVRLKDYIIDQVVGAAADAVLQYAAKALLKSRYRTSYTVPCSIYPPNSGEYVRCSRG